MGDWARIQGDTIYVQRREGEGLPVLLINGIGAHHAMWEPVLGALAGRPVVTFDPPGIGRSPLSVRALTIGDYAELALGALAACGHDRADVVGYSFGGSVAQELAHRAPNAVRRLVLVGTCCGWGGIPGSPAALAVIASPLRYYSKAFHYATAGWISGGTAESDPAFLRRTTELRLRHPPSVPGYTAQLGALALWSSLPWLHTLAAPTLVLTGDADPVLPWANGALLAHTIPTSRLQLHPDEGHFLLLDPTSSAIGCIADFFDAPRYETSEAWRTAVEVSADDARRAIAETRPSAQPFALMNAFFRAAC